MTEIINISLESDLSEFTSTVTDGGDLAWSNDATAQAVAGTSGAMSLTIDDTNGLEAIKTVTASTTGVVRSRFYLDINGLTIPDASSFNACYMLSTSSILLVFIGYADASGYRIRLALRNDLSGYEYTNWVDITNEPHYLEYKIVRATNNSSSDGYVDWWIDGSAQTSKTGVDNFDRFGDFRTIDLGCPDGVSAGISGVFYIDEIVVNDDGSEIGPVGVVGEVTWGHDTGVTEINVRDFTGNWTGTAAISGSGDSEVIEFDTGEYMESEIVNTGAYTVTITENKYGTGDSFTIEYRHAATQAGVSAASYNTYSVPFTSLGYVQIRVT